MLRYIEVENAGSRKLKYLSVYFKISDVLS